MLESTLGGRYANTKALARNMPQKHFERIGDKALARKLSKQGNDLLNKKDDPPAALAAYQSAYANDPSSSEITGSYGYALFRNGRFAEARDMETQCLELAPEYAAAWFVLGQIYGYLKQEDMAYASFVNTCLFTKNISTSLGFLEREIVKYGEVTVQQAAARALTACRSLSSEGPAEPAPMRQGAGQAAPPAAPAGAGAQWKNARIGKVDIRTALTDSKLFQSMIAKMAKMPKSQIDSWLDAQLGPVIVELQGILRGYATANNFLLVIKSEDERKVRGDGSLRTSLGGLVEDDGFVAYLDTPEGRAYRRTAPIQDLTPVVAAKLGPR
jgi:tetratricopeptide (TPR) repeat protein